MVSPFVVRMQLAVAQFAVVLCTHGAPRSTLLLPVARSARTSSKCRMSTLPLFPMYGPSAAGFHTLTEVDHGPHVGLATVSSSGDAVSDEKPPAPEKVNEDGEGVTVLQITAPVAASNSSTVSPAARTANVERG